MRKHKRDWSNVSAAPAGESAGSVAWLSKSQLVRLCPQCLLSTSFNYFCHLLSYAHVLFCFKKKTLVSFMRWFMICSDIYIVPQFNPFVLPNCKQTCRIKFLSFLKRCLITLLFVRFPKCKGCKNSPLILTTLDNVSLLVISSSSQSFPLSFLGFALLHPHS